MCFNKWCTTVINLFLRHIETERWRVFLARLPNPRYILLWCSPMALPGVSLLSLLSVHRHLYLFGPGQHWSCVHSCTLGASYLVKDADYFLNFHFALSLLLRLFSSACASGLLLPWRLPSLQICSPFLYSDPL